jgi:alpha-1,4-galacturonosyltransferase
MGGKVIGAVQFCEVRLGQLKPYMADHNVNANSCVWLSGLNVIELDKWRDMGITSLYDQSFQKVSRAQHSH